MAYVSIAVGLALVLFGRRLFWLFVGGIGFVAGVTIVGKLAGESMDHWMTLAIALLAGLLGALLCIFLQKLALGVAGFLGGGIAAVKLFELMETGHPEYWWLALLVGGVMGALLLLLLFGAALVLLSSVVGAGIVAESTSIPSPWPVAVFLLLVLVGIAVQSRGLSSGKGSTG
jgi:hypothetical protein